MTMKKAAKETEKLPIQELESKSSAALPTKSKTAKDLLDKFAAKKAIERAQSHLRDYENQLQTQELKAMAREIDDVCDNLTSVLINLGFGGILRYTLAIDGVDE